MSDCEEYLVFDVGGTNLRAAIYDASAKRITSLRKRAVALRHMHMVDQAEKPLTAFLASLVSLANEVLEGRHVCGVSIAFPGPVDARGYALAAPTLFRTPPQKLQLHKLFSDCWPKQKVFLLNDMSAAGYRYVDMGYKDFCVFTVSSGIGQKIFVNGFPLIGPNALGGEVGHLVVDRGDSAPRCDCGGKGHLGAVSSGRGVLKAVKLEAQNDFHRFSMSLLGRLSEQSVGSITNEAIVSAFREDDEWTRRLIIHTSKPLTNVIAAIHLSTGIEQFVITGGFSKALGEKYRRILVEGAMASCWDTGQNWEKMISQDNTDDEIGLIGAGVYASRQTNVKLGRLHPT